MVMKGRWLLRCRICDKIGTLVSGCSIFVVRCRSVWWSSAIVVLCSVGGWASICVVAKSSTVVTNNVCGAGRARVSPGGSRIIQRAPLIRVV